MWSHYAFNHQGICLRFRSLKDCNDKEKEQYYLEFDYFEPYSALRLARNDPFHNLFYESPFLEIEYGVESPDPLNMFDEDRDIKLHNFLLNKFKDWSYEEEYRMIIDDDIEGVIFGEAFEKGFVRYRKEDLEGVIFGLKMNHKNAKLVYDTIKKNYLDEGVVVNFYEAIEVPRKYVVEIEPIENIEKYIDSRPKDTNL